jgi:hypothetical protein
VVLWELPLLALPTGPGDGADCALRLAELRARALFGPSCTHCLIYLLLDTEWPTKVGNGEGALAVLDLHDGLPSLNSHLSRALERDRESLALALFTQC